VYGIYQNPMHGSLLETTGKTAYIDFPLHESIRSGKIFYGIHENEKHLHS
jgi:hypothetical protein